METEARLRQNDTIAVSIDVHRAGNTENKKPDERMSRKSKKIKG